MQKLKGLIDKLNAASKAYYEGKEAMSDKEFDDLYSKLVELEKSSGVVLPNSPTRRIGFDAVSPLPKVKHEFRALSLESTKCPKSLAAWLGDNRGILSWKYDGLTVILTYEDGKLVRAATRGNGEVGEDIFHNAFYFTNVPYSIDDKRRIIVRGEAVVSFDIFKQINETLPPEKQYKNPRSMAAGAVRYLNANMSAPFKIHYIPFSLVNAQALGFTRVSDSLAYLSAIGLEPVSWVIVDGEVLPAAIEQHENEVESLPYATDGLVVVFDELSLHNQFGETSKFPRYAKAFKWRDILRTSILRGVEWSVSKNGLISPIAIFDPVELEGTTVKRASLHNLRIMSDLGLGIGDQITVYKANMMIPQVCESIEKSGGIDIPTACPVCSAPAKRRLGVNGVSEFLYCINAECPARKPEKEAQ